MMKQRFMLLSLTLFMACTQNEPTKSTLTEEKLINTDSLVQRWNAAWNAHDSSAIMNLMDESVILIGETTQVHGKDSIGALFVGKNAPVLRDLKTRLITSGSSGNQAYVYGTYTHDVQLPDTLLKGIHGNFSLVYQLAQERWKLRVIQIEED